MTPPWTLFLMAVSILGNSFLQARSPGLTELAALLSRSLSSNHMQSSCVLQAAHGVSFITERPSPSPSPEPWPCSGDTWVRRNGHFKANTSHVTQVLSGPLKGAHGPGHCYGEGWKNLLGICTGNMHAHVPMDIYTLTTDFGDALTLIWKANT